MSFTTNAWGSDVNSDSLIGFTALWIDSDFYKPFAVLHAQELYRRVYCYEDHQNAGRVEYSFVSGSMTDVVIRDNGVA